MATILLVGGDAALLEGLSQFLGALGHGTRTVATLHDAREHAAAAPPLIVVADRRLAAESSSDMLAIPLAAGGALLLYGGTGIFTGALTPGLQRVVLADLRLPLERNRLVALVQHVEERTRATGRGRRDTPTEHRAP